MRLLGKSSRRKQRDIDGQRESAAPRLAAAAEADRRKLAWIAAGIAALIFATFGSVSTHDFISYDDPSYVTANPVVSRGLTAEGFRWAFRSVTPYYWQPLTWITHMADVSLFGMDAGSHLLVNVALHAASAVLLFLTLAALTSATWPAAVVATLWALHPLRVESVAWVAERKDVLSTLLFIITVALYTRYVRSRTPARFAAVAVAFALALMAKPMVVTLPVALLLLDFWPLRRTDWRRAVLEKTVLVIPASAVALLTLAGQKTAIGAVPLWLRLTNATVSYVEYLGKHIWPAGLAVVYPYRERVAAAAVILCAVVLLVITLVAIRIRASRPYVLTGWLWYLVMLLPVIGIIQAGPQSMADRFTYLPSIGLLIAIVWLAVELLPDRRVLAILAGVAIVLSAVLTVRQVRAWRDSETLFTHAVRVTNRNVVAHLNLAQTLAAKGRVAEAMPHFEAALEASKGAPIPLIEIGTQLVRQRRYAEAVEPLSRAVRLSPDSVIAQQMLGNALLYTGKPAEALPHLAAALPGSDAARQTEIRYSIAGAKLELGRIDEAIAELEALTRANPGLPGGHDQLGNAYSRKGNEAAAEREYRAAIALDPNLYDARMNLAALLTRGGRNDEALEQVAAASRAHPQNPEPHIYRALILANLGRNQEAAASASTAMTIDPGRSNELFTKAVRLPPNENNLRDFIKNMGGR